MGSNSFAPVKVYFGKPGQTQIVSSARKAGELFTHARRGTPTQEDAVAAVYAALHGSVRPEAVRKAFVAAVDEAGLLIDD